MIDQEQLAGDPNDTLFGHPRGLFVLFFAEMWERFSYYGMRALLILYMTKSLMYEEEVASWKYGAYTGLVYATPLFGGMLADRFLGYRKAIILGGILMALGHFAMVITHPFFFYGALALLIAGNGFFKPNISTMVGKLYAQDDPRRDGAFTIFYFGINLGAFFSPLVCGLIGQTYGWHYGFGLAGIGMIIGLLVFQKGTKYLGDHGLPPRPEAMREPFVAGVPKIWALYIGILLFLPVAAVLVYQPKWVQVIVPGIALLFLGYIGYEMARSSAAERSHIAVILILVFFSITFWACFEQAGSSMTLFTDAHVDRHLLGWEVPAAVFQSVNPGFILLLSIPFAAMWTWLGRKKMNPSSSLKFALAIIQMGAGFVAMVIAAKEAAAGEKSAIGWLILAYFLHTTGELCLSPVGLSMVTKLAPARLAGLLMGAWFLSNAFANVIGGMIAAMTSGDAGYVGVFTTIVYFAFGAAALLLVITPLLKKMERRTE